MLIGLARSNSHKQITVLSGHTHCAASQNILPNLHARVESPIRIDENQEFLSL
jgi:hypothetical protein